MHKVENIILCADIIIETALRKPSLNRDITDGCAMKALGTENSGRGAHDMRAPLRDAVGIFNLRRNVSRLRHGDILPAVKRLLSRRRLSRKK
jgi:hypothetical protein